MIIDGMISIALLNQGDTWVPTPDDPAPSQPGEFQAPRPYLTLASAISLRTSRCLSRSESTDWLSIALDAAFRMFVPADVECPIVWKKIECRVGKILVDPSREDPPVTLVLVFGPEARDDYASHCSHVSVLVEPIPNVSREITLVGSASVAGLLLALHLVAETIDLA